METNRGIYMDGVNVVLIDAPTEIKGSVNKNRDGTYTIIINSRMSYDQQLKTYEHEISHIVNDDFSKNDVQAIEYEAHNRNKKSSSPIPSNEYLERIKCIKRKREQARKQLEEYDASLAYLQRLGVV